MHLEIYVLHVPQCYRYIYKYHLQNILVKISNSPQKNKSELNVLTNINFAEKI